MGIAWTSYIEMQGTYILPSMWTIFRLIKIIDRDISIVP